MKTKPIKQSFWDSWSMLHSSVFNGGGISDWKLMGLTMEVKELTISIVDKLTEIENHCSKQTVIKDV